MGELSAAKSGCLLEKNQNGSFREDHYEGELHSDYVSIIQYDEYNFENRRQDMIFIHNLYDASKYVTSIYPFFYTANLKKFTDELIYILYFVLVESDLEKDEALKGIPIHFFG